MNKFNFENKYMWLLELSMLYHFLVNIYCNSWKCVQQPKFQIIMYFIYITRPRVIY